MPEKDTTTNAPIKGDEKAETSKEETKADEKPLETKLEEPEGKVLYNGMKVVRVVVQNKEQKKFLRELENKGGK